MPGFSDINFLYNKYYGDNPRLREIVTIHSKNVARKAIGILRKRQLDLDPGNVFIAAMLHDIGVVKCYAPDIHAFGHLPYLLHGIEGEKILIENNLEFFSSVCANHIGAGITRDEIIKNNLPLPEKDYIPTTLLERLICYSDKFFSKSGDLNHEKSPEHIVTQLEKFGKDSVSRFLDLHQEFSID